MGKVKIDSHIWGLAFNLWTEMCIYWKSIMV